MQPRGPIDPDEIRQLSDSLKRHGVLQPISVRRTGEGFEIIAGERRWRAAQLAGLSEVPVVVREASDEQMLELALIENLQREDLNAIDRARAYRQFCERFRLSDEHVALRMGEDRSTVANYLRLLELPESVQAMVASKRLGMAHARMILSEPNALLRAKLAELVVSRELTVRAIEDVIRKGREIAEGRGEALAGKQPVAPDRLRSAHLRDMEQKFERALKTRVNIKEGRKKGSGKIVIDFFTLDDFDRVAGALGINPE
jgi:ParB family chromosome partitioning protein